MKPRFFNESGTRIDRSLEYEESIKKPINHHTGEMPRLRRLNPKKWGDEAQYLGKNVYRCPNCGALCAGANSLSDHVFFCGRADRNYPYGTTGRVRT